MWLPECFWKAYSVVYKEDDRHSHKMQVSGNPQLMYWCVKPPEPDFPPYLYLSVMYQLSLFSIDRQI